MSFDRDTSEFEYNDNKRECGRIFLTLKENLVFHCTICSKNFCSFFKYRDHLKSLHWGNLEYEIENDFDDVSSVSEELALGLGDSESLMKSETQIFQVSENLLGKQERSDSETLLFKIENKDQKHFPKKKKTQGGRKGSVCPVCKETLSKNTHLKTHMKRHTNEKNHKCSDCTKAFFTRCELDTHIRGVHSGERPYLCTACGKAFTTASKLNAHINQKHIRKRDKQCPICSMSFYSNILLKGHMITHDDARPFKCEMCDSKFKRRKGLLSHMKMHENKKEYVCDLCPARFNQKCNLNSHRKSKHGILAPNEDVSCNNDGTYIKVGKHF